MSRILIVAYGNPMRCDDGVAWRASDELEKKFSNLKVEILRTHQLTPELAATVSLCEAVIFVDAASANAVGNGLPGEIRVGPVGLAPIQPGFSHHVSPGVVMALASELFRATPHAVAVTVTGESFDHGEELSAVVKAALPDLVQRIATLAQEFLDQPAPMLPANS